MNKIMNAILLVLVVSTLSACGVATEDFEKVVSENSTLRSDLARTKKNLEDKSNALDAEIKAKKAHAVREEQYKQRLKQAERDHTSDAKALRLCGRKK